MTSASPQLLLVRAHWDHMAPVSGFDGLARAICRVVGESNVVSLGTDHSRESRLAHLAGRVARRLRLLPRTNPVVAPICPFFVDRHHRTAQEMVQLLTRFPASIGILLAGEEQFGEALRHAPPDVRRGVVVVLHQPPSWLRLHWRDFAALNGLRAIICLSAEQRAFVASCTTTPAIQIRHGVDLDFFRPSHRQPRSRPRLLLVGHWLRDFPLVYDAIQRIWANDATVEIDCVVPWHARVHDEMVRFARDTRVRWHAGISADDLRALYASADLLFLPVIDATANNAVVEALACGLPVISTQVGGMPDYVTETTGELCEPGNPASHADAVSRWLGDDARREAGSRAAREFAEQALDWNTIARTLMPQLA